MRKQGHKTCAASGFLLQQTAQLVNLWCTHKRNLVKKSGPNSVSRDFLVLSSLLTLHLSLRFSLFPHLICITLAVSSLCLTVALSRLQTLHFFSWKLTGTDSFCLNNTNSKTVVCLGSLSVFSLCCFYFPLRGVSQEINCVYNIQKSGMHRCITIM